MSTVDYQGETPLDISRPPKPQPPPEPQTSTESVQSKDAKEHPATTRATHSESSNFLVKGLERVGELVDKGVKGVEKIVEEVCIGGAKDKKTVPAQGGNSPPKSDTRKTGDSVKSAGENKEEKPPFGRFVDE